MADIVQIQIDCSHGNSQKQHRRQIEVVEDIVSIP
jgi:3-deoxy-7-phosphoheptulonate synthase